MQSSTIKTIKVLDSCFQFIHPIRIWRSWQSVGSQQKCDHHYDWRWHYQTWEAETSCWFLIWSRWRGHTCQWWQDRGQHRTNTIPFFHAFPFAIKCCFLWFIWPFSMFSSSQASLWAKEKCPLLDIWVLPKTFWRRDPSRNIYTTYFKHFLTIATFCLVIWRDVTTNVALITLTRETIINISFQVKERIIGSVLPWPGKNFIHLYLRRNPDLYGTNTNMSVLIRGVRHFLGTYFRKLFPCSVA